MAPLGDRARDRFCHLDLTRTIFATPRKSSSGLREQVGDGLGPLLLHGLKLPVTNR